MLKPVQHDVVLTKSELFEPQEFEPGLPCSKLSSYAIVVGVCLWLIDVQCVCEIARGFLT